MPRLIIITLGCDWDGCTVEGPEDGDVVVPKTLSIDGNKPKQFLLCKTHVDDFEAVVMPLMQAGVKVTNTKRSTKTTAPSPVAPTKGKFTGGGAGPQEFICQAPSKTEPDEICGRKLHNRTGMAQHAIRGHGFDSLAAYEARYPVTPDNHE